MQTAKTAAGDAGVRDVKIYRFFDFHKLLVVPTMPLKCPAAPFHLDSFSDFTWANG
jgi:hypothetical protein